MKQNILPHAIEFCSENPLYYLKTLLRPVKNTAFTHNPVEPKRIEVAGVRVFVNVLILAVRLVAVLQRIIYAYAASVE